MFNIDFFTAGEIWFLSNVLSNANIGFSQKGATDIQETLFSSSGIRNNYS